MAKFFNALDQKLSDFIRRQHIFFTATAAAEGRINLSPKGLDSFRILDDNTVAWLNLTGSGNETAAHLREVNRMTVMFCSFEKNPLIMRLYGTADTVHKNDARWAELYALFPPDPGARQIFVMHIDNVQTSCGYAVPFYEFQKERHVLTDWAERKGEAGIQDYQKEKNVKSIDGLATGIEGNFDNKKN